MGGQREKKTSADLPVKVLISTKVNAGHCKSFRVITNTFDQYLKNKLKSFMRTELISLPESIEIIRAEQPYILPKIWDGPESASGIILEWTGKQSRREKNHTQSLHAIETGISSSLMSH